MTMAMLMMSDNDDNNDANDTGALVANSDATGLLSTQQKKALVSILFWMHKQLNDNIKIERSITSFRIRRPVSSIFNELGAYYTRRAFRMTDVSFWKLHRLILKYTKYTIINPADSQKGIMGIEQRNGAVNGLIPSTIRLSAAIRYFAGGSVYDIACMHGISVRQVYTSVWRVVDAVNKTFKITFPESKSEQEYIATGFKLKSKAGFDGCVGCVDGMLLWTDRPTEKEAEKAGIGSKKFYCGRKKKYGLIMTGCVDHEQRFTDVDIKHPGATSDYLAFAMSNLKSRLEDGLLHDDNYLFGDCAYSNTTYMVTPF